MKSYTSVRLIAIVLLLLIVAMLTSLSCSDKGKPSTPAGNQAPTALTVVMPADGATGIPANFILQWTASDPDNDPISYNLYFGIDSIPSHDSTWSESNSYYSPWYSQCNAQRLLLQIYEMQMAYHQQYNTYCLDGVSTHAGDSSFYALLNVVPELLDPYNYIMHTSIYGFTCFANADMNGDGSNDIWSVGYPYSGNNPLYCNSNEIEHPFEINTKYYWQIIARDSYGNQTNGPVWYFTTGSNTAGINMPPEIPLLISPRDGVNVSLDTLVFTWQSMDPDGDPLGYRFYLSTSPDLIYSYGYTSWPFRPSAQLMRVKLREFLGRVYTLQSAYRNLHGSYCLNGQMATYGQNGFAPIGAIVDSLDGYLYAMMAEVNTFTCTATANLDDDATWDTWTINQDSFVVCTINDFVTLKSTAGLYYWRIGAKDNHGHISLSPIWTFTTP